jgi:putative ABC transport system permease protein
MDIAQDVRHGIRSLARSPLLTLAAVVSLGLGIGAATLIFHVADSVLLRPLPYPRPERLFMAWESYPELGFEQMWVSYPDFRDLAAGSAGVAELAAYKPVNLNLSGAGAPERLRGARITAGLLTVLGVRPELGRSLSAAEETAGNDRLVLLGHAFWEQRFQADPAILGRDLTLDGRRCTVIGVLPAWFRFPRDAALWVPLVAPREPSRGAHNLEVVARLRRGATPEVLATTLARTAHTLAATFPESNRGMGVRLVGLREQEIGEVRPALLLLGWGVALLLVIALINVANLLLARMMARRGELVMRLALGEPRRRLARRLFVEGWLLVLPGMAAGLLFAALGVHWLPAVAPSDIPRLVWGSLVARDLACALSIALGAGALIALYPALRGGRLAPRGVLEESAARTTGDRRSLRFQRALVVSEVALSLMLVISTGLLLRSFYRLARTDPGLHVRGLITAQLALPMEKYHEPHEIVSFSQRLLARLRALPQVAAVATTQVLPLTENHEGTVIAPAGATRAQDDVAVSVTAVSPDYFRVMGIPVRAGRSFDERDGASAPPVAVISENLAHRLWPGADPVGKRLQIPHFPETARTVIGVVGDVRQVELRSAAPSIFYLPMDQMPGPKPFMAVLLRLRAPVTQQDLQRAVESVDPEQPFYDVRRGEELVASALTRPRFWAVVLAVFAGVALLLTLVGVYGVLAYVVSLRTREMGIRVAVGASVGDVLRLILAAGLRLGALGIVLGLAGSLLSARLLQSLLYGVNALDPWTLGAAVPLLLLWCGLASYLPARRAARLDPQAALREA